MNDNRDLQVGETMFEFLKRKKRSALENTLKTSRQVTQRNNMSPVPASDFSKTRREAPSTLTPDSTPRNQLEDARPATRSFMQMISPIRSKSPVPDNKSPAKDKVKVKNDNYGRRALLQKAGEMRESMQSALRIGRQLNEKFRALGVEVNSLIKACSGQQGQTAKAILRGCQNGLRQLGTPGRQQALDAFFSSLWQQLDQFQGDTRLQVEDARKTLTQDLGQKDHKIRQLEQNILSLDRQIAALNRRNQKVESTHEQIRQNVVKQYEQYKQVVSARIIQLEENISTLERQVLIKEDQKRTAIEDVSRLQGQIKRAKFDREKYQQECLNTITRVKSEQQQFLLNQIMHVKAQCATDMAQLATLHRQKEESLQLRLLQANAATKKMKTHLQDILQASQRTEEVIIALKAQNTRIKKQNDCMAIDMHRINEQLYQHWLALKDVKTLSIRLDSFHQFRKIYEDLGFNEQLFL